MNPEALKRHALQENKGLVSVAGLAMRLAKEEEQGTQLTASAVLGILISFQRRALHLSHQALAMSAAVELEQLLRIEGDPTYRAEIATIRRLAEALRLPASQLLAISGDVRTPNEKLRKAAAQFAARVQEEKLNQDQSKALHDFVQALMEAA